MNLENIMDEPNSKWVTLGSFLSIGKTSRKVGNVGLFYCKVHLELTKQLLFIIIVVLALEDNFVKLHCYFCFSILVKMALRTTELNCMRLTLNQSSIESSKINFELLMTSNFLANHSDNITIS